MTETGFSQHNHNRCIAHAIAQAESFCAQQRLQFTPVRRRVLEILLQKHRAMGAYDVLGILAQEGHERQPPIVYRALEFLVGHGFAHRIERLNAYVACAHPGQDHAPAFMICNQCAAVAEAAQDAGLMNGLAQSADFHISHTVIEAEGLCPKCHRKEAAE